MCRLMAWAMVDSLVEQLRRPEGPQNCKFLVAMSTGDEAITERANNIAAVVIARF